jgi:hypothetical protein
MSADLARIAAKLDTIIDAVACEGAEQFEAWRPMIERRGFADSAANLAAYLAARRRDLRVVQRELAALGLSSLGRMEGRVMPTLMAVKGALAALRGETPTDLSSSAAFYTGKSLPDRDDYRLLKHRGWATGRSIERRSRPNPRRQFRMIRTSTPPDGRRH